MNQLYWKDKEAEQATIDESAFISSLIELCLMWKEDVKKNPKHRFDSGVFYFPKKEEPKKENKIKLKTRGERRRLIDEKLKISQVAKHYGFKVENNKMICPFHQDTDPSLSLNDVGNCFYCFGCHATGDIVDFVGRLDEWKGKKQ